MIEDRYRVTVEEYVWLHEECGEPEWRVAKALGISMHTLHDYLRAAGHPRPAKTVQEAMDMRHVLSTTRARVGT